MQYLRLRNPHRKDLLQTNRCTVARRQKAASPPTTPDCSSLDSTQLPLNLRVSATLERGWPNLTLFLATSIGGGQSMKNSPRSNRANLGQFLQGPARQKNTV